MKGVPWGFVKACAKSHLERGILAGINGIERHRTRTQKATQAMCFIKARGEWST